MHHRPSLALLAAAVAIPACVAGEGKEPALERFYFPTGLEQSADLRYLYVVNSDFDLQFTGGSAQSVDLSRVRALVPRECSTDADCPTQERCDTEGTKGQTPSYWCVAKSGAHAGEPCGPFGEKTAAEELLQPGRCGAVEPSQPQDGGSSLLVDAVKISALATDAVFRERPAGADGSDGQIAGRLFIPVRGDATLHWIDMKSDGTLDCGQPAGGECDDRHKVGDRPAEENTRRLRLPTEPFGIASSEDGAVIVMTHPTQGALSLFENDWRAASEPRLQFVLGGLPSSPSGVALVPGPIGESSSGDPRANPEFLVDFRNAAELRLFRFFGDEGATPARPFLQQTRAVAITALANGTDSRGVAIDSSEREACESACAGEADCDLRCQDVSARLFVANRSPASLLVGEIEFIQNVAQPPQLADSIPLPYGPSRVVVGQVLDETGQPVTRVFVVCFESRRIGIYNPGLKLIETWVITGRGPHALVVDVGPRKSSSPDYALAYVAHFTDSYLGVVQLDQRQPRTYGQMVVTLGKSSPPRSSK
ncbi:MAG: hypothetical protein JW940_30360 [Polyangiaceae bacterium]|nr:hypothetical protein [Polyangiaceae bacterium]